MSLLEDELIEPWQISICCLATLETDRNSRLARLLLGYSTTHLGINMVES